MPRLLAQVMLSVLTFPLGTVFYAATFCAAYYLFERYGYYDKDDPAFVIAGFATWFFLALYVWFVWRRCVRPTSLFWRRTMVSVAVALAAGLALGGMTALEDTEFGIFIGSVSAPIVWLTAIVVALRETDEERSGRLGKVSADSVVCPKCGYSLTGLSEARCPECGARYTLSELLAAQPARAVEQLL